MKAHPDKGGSEAKMAAVNEAYEVLSKPGSYHFHPLFCHPRTKLISRNRFTELRARFDNGDDPNDPQSGQQGGHPFGGHGGHPFAHMFGGGQQHFQFQWSG